MSPNIFLIKILQRHVMTLQWSIFAIDYIGKVFRSLSFVAP